jgi:hypothetical protein
MRQDACPEIADLHGNPFVIRESEMRRKLLGDGTEKRDAGHPELMFAQRDPGSVCSREFHFFVIHDAPIVTMRADYAC